MSHYNTEIKEERHIKDVYSPYQELELANWKKYLSENTDFLKSSFNEIIERYHFDNLKNLPEDERNLKQLEFFHGIGDLNLELNIRTIENDLDLDEIKLYPEYENQINQFDFEFDDNLGVLYEEYRESRLYADKKDLLFQWFANLWQECGGHKIGVVTRSFENNAAQCFDFTFMHWEDYKDLPEAEVGIKINYPFNRNLTEREILSRIQLDNYKRYKAQYWYFENQDNFFEIGLFNNVLGIRKGNIIDFLSVPFNLEYFKNEYGDTRFKVKKKIATLFDELVNQGYFEQKRPQNAPVLLENLIEWDNDIEHDNKKKIDLTELVSFQELTNVQLPLDYHFFLTHVPFPKINSYLHYKKNEKWVRLKEIFPIEVLLSKRINQIKDDKIPRRYLPIAEDYNNDIVLLGFEKNDFAVYIWENKNDLIIKINNSFKDFIYACTSFISAYNASYHFEKNNLSMIKKWIAEGKDVNYKFSEHPDSVPIYCVNTYAATKILLENGANVEHISILHLSNYSLEYFQLLVDYRLDIKKKFAQHEWLRGELLKKEGFEKFKELLDF